jgi:hypothetical protein
VTLLLWLWAIGWTALTAGAGWMRLQNPFFVDVPLLAVLPALGLLGWRRARLPAVLAAACALAWLGLASRVGIGPLKLRAMVYGVDGATFDVIDTMELPAFERLRTEGARGRLLSMEPMFSPLLWTTMASGRPPEEHGIKGFHVQSKDCRVARWWDIAEEEGDAIGLYKWLVDYPPRTFAHGGFWVPSWLAPAPDAWPTELSVVKEVELSRRLRRKQVESKRSSLEQAADLARIGVRMSTLGRAALWSAKQRFLHPDTVTTNVQMQLIRGWMDRDVFIAQLHAKDPEVASFTYYATDGLAHLYWDRHAAGGDEIRSAYRQADAILGAILGELGPEARLVVVSDHGFQAMNGTGLAGQFTPLTEKLRERLSAAVGPVDVSKLGHKLVVGTRDNAQRQAALAALATLVDAKGQPFYAVADIPDMPSGIGLTLADEAVTAERMRAETVGGAPITDYVSLTDPYTGTHEQHGVIYLWGKDVPAGKDLGDEPMLDVAPTFLAAAGLPADQHMKGQALIFPEVPRVESWDKLMLDLTWLDGEGGVNDDRLKELGYTGS